MLKKFLIDVPPPTISGSLHLGHIFSYTHMDVVARNALRQGKGLVYPFCYDNNGLPTEKLASKAGITDPMEIYEFSVRKAYAYRNLFNDMAMAYGNDQYNTFSPQAVALADMSFNDLRRKDLVYKADTEFLYCPVLKTSVSQSEVDENGIYERSGAKVEIRKGEGWFIRVKDKLKEIRHAIDQITWKPDGFKHRLHRWLDDVKYDWSISRTRKWGIRMEQDTQFVYDTWFISSLSPQLAWHAHTKSPLPSLHCPIFDCRFQAHDIIRTWALFTIIKSLYHSEQIPWHNIIISGHALSPKGDKLAKSLGNASDPYEYIDRYTSDGVRYWACHTQTGADTRIDLESMNYGKKLCNKIRNAKRFLDMQTAGGTNEGYEQCWSDYKAMIEKSLDSFNWAEGLSTLTQFFWQTFCDQWIEASKKSPANDSLKKILTDMMPLFGVFMPKIAKEIGTETLSD